MKEIDSTLINVAYASAIVTEEELAIPDPQVIEIPEIPVSGECKQ